MSDESQVAQDQKLEPQNPVMPSPSVSTQPLPQSQPQPINDTVASIPSSVYKKHGLPISFKSLSLIILFLLMGSVFVISQLSLQKGSLDMRSRASKKEGSVLKNGSFEQKLLNWKEMKKDRSDKIEIIAQGATQGANAVKLTNTSGKELLLYQDIKVEPETWYTMRADGKTLEGSGSAYLEAREYDLINGKPNFNGNRLTKRVFGTTVQSRGDIIRSGGVKMAITQTLEIASKDNTSQSSLIRIGVERVSAEEPLLTCMRDGYIQETPAGGKSSNRCSDTNYSKALEIWKSRNVDSFFSEEGLPQINSWIYYPNAAQNCVKYYNCSGKVRCLISECISKNDPDYPDTCRTGNMKSVIVGIGQGNGNLLCDIAKYPKDGCYPFADCTSQKPNNPPTTISIPPKPICTTDDDCTKKKPDTFCEAGVCKDRPAQCGTLCYDPAEGDVPATTIEDRCKPLICAPAQSDGKRYCWGDACSGGGGAGGGGGGQKPAEKYIRIQLTMEKKGSAIFDNVRFTKGQDNAGPKITSTAPSMATVGAQLTYQVIATDENRDTLTFGLDALPCPFNNKNCKKEKVAIPKNAAISPSGLFTFTPEASGTAKIQLWVSDSMKPTKQEFRLTIN